MSTETTTWWRGKRVVVTGGAGFLGSAICRRLRERGAADVVAVRSADFDLVDRADAARMFDRLRPDIVVHAAGVGGGIAAHRAHPGLHFHANAAMALHVVDEAHAHGLQKLVYVGSADSYPPAAPVPTREEELWNGPLEPNSAAFGLAKKLPVVMLEAYRAEHGLRSASLILTNVYGPGASFDPEGSHVIPAMIRRFDDAARSGADEVVCWGTGAATRDFLYVDDAAAGVVLAAERLEDAEAVNIGSGVEVSIATLAETVADLCGCRGRIRWDTSKPDGHPRRALDVTRARDLLGFEPRTPLGQGLANTIAHYRELLRTSPATTPRAAR